MKTSGMETPNQRKTSTNIVVNGTVPEDFSPQRSALRTKNIMNTTPGNITAVLMVIIFHSEPLNIL
uniref:Uncharacterized protein n=1 Tax=Arundo donax TaxID=35708 RepID=A0A0A8YDQ2_ARUDO